MNKLFYLFIVATLCACGNSSNTEKYQDERDNVINVRDRVKEIDVKDVMISGAATFIINDYLIIADHQSPAELIHILDKNTFKYLISSVFKGRGPGEIINMGHLGINETNREFYITDHGKYKIFKYNLDSLLANPLYVPIVKIKMNEKQFPSRYQYINDSLSIGIIIEPIGHNNFTQWMAKWNMNTGEIKPMKYQHPDILKKRFMFAASIKDSIYVECNLKHDLITICSFDGDLKWNIYGPNWTPVATKVDYFSKVLFCNDKIVVLYTGGDSFVLNENERLQSTSPTKFMVFDTNGDYIKTLETGVQIINFCFDKGNNRIIMSLDDTIQFAYLDLDGLID